MVRSGISRHGLVVLIMVLGFQPCRATGYSDPPVGWNESADSVCSDGTHGSPNPANLPISQEINPNRRIVVGGDADFPPYEYLDNNGQPAGFNVELFRAVAREAGITVDIRLGLWKGMRESLLNGQIDAISGMFYSRERSLTFELSVPHCLVSQVFVYRRREPVPLSLSDLQGRTVIVEEGDIMDDLVKGQGNARQVITAANEKAALDLLAAGRGDYVLCARTLALHYIKSRHLNGLVVSDKPVMQAEYGFAVQKGNEALLDALNEGLTVVKASGEYRKLYSKWLGPYDEPRFTFLDSLKYAAFILVPILVVLLLVLGWNRTLRHQVTQRTESILESEEKLRQIAENTHQVFWLTDWINKELLYVSPAYETLYGMSVESAYHDRLSWKKPIHPDDLPYVEEVFRESRDKETAAEAEYRIVHDDGEIRWVYDRSFPICDEEGRVYRFVSIAEDITDRKLMEIKLQETVDELARSRDRAEESDRLKSSFLANMSHEIRTPMNGILGFADLLEEPDLDNDDRRKYVRIIQQSGERMLSLINDLIDISKIEAGQITIFDQRTDIIQVLRDLQVFFEPEAKQKGLGLIFESDDSFQELFLETDRTRLQQILSNLIKNALKFTNTGKVAFGCRNQESGILFYVRDTGIGISPENQSKIFDRFQRDRQPEMREVEGAGLGLSISKALVELLGGRLWLESEPGKGSTFSFILPLKR
jgi:PAS domain S-box-containing protein